MMIKKSKIMIMAVLAAALMACTLTVAYSDSEMASATDPIIGGGDYKSYNWLINKTVDEQLCGYWMYRTEGSLPQGVTFSNGKLTGKPTVAGTYWFKVIDTLPGWIGTQPSTTAGITVYNPTPPAPVMHTVTYNAGAGTVNGQATWSTQIEHGNYAPWPSATHSTYSFLGWAETPSGSVITAQQTITADITYYAKWSIPSTSVSSHSATIPVGQSMVPYTFSTSPSNATISVTSYGGLTGLSLSGKTLSGTPSATPGTYYVTVKCTAPGYYSSTGRVTVVVPIEIVEPIQYSVVKGSVWSYEPVTNPSNATITITSVKLDGSTYSGHNIAVSGRTITGTLNSVGTVSVTFSASGGGYTSWTKTVLIAVTEPPATHQPVAIGDITVSRRAAEPRTFDLIATGVAHAANIQWYVDNVLFASSHTTAVYEVPTAGKYAVKCVVTGTGGDTQNVTKDIFCDETYHPEMAWVGVKYTCPFPYGVTVTESVDWLTVGDYTDAQNRTCIYVYGTPTATHLGRTYVVDPSTGDDISIVVYPAKTVAPVSNFAVTVNGQRVNVDFTGTDASRVYYDYGDGSPITTIATHEYAHIGHYTITATAVNNISERASSQAIAIGVIPRMTVDIHNMVDMEIGLNEVLLLEIDMAAGDVLSLSGDATAWLSLRDGNIVTGRATELGYYTLTLTLRHSDSTTTTGTMHITVREGGASTEQTVPIASFSYTVDGMTVRFRDSSVAPSVWQWSFGDTKTSTDQHPEHIYEQKGTYTVTLTVANSTGMSDTTSAMIAVGIADDTPCTVAFDVAGGSALEPIETKTGKIITLPAAIKSGSTFEGWYSGATKVGNAGSMYTVIGDITLAAHYVQGTVPVHSVIFHYTDGRVYSTQTVVDGGRAVHQQGPAENGKKFLAWHTEEGKQYQFSKAVTGDVKLYAHYESVSGDGMTPVILLVIAVVLSLIIYFGFRHPILVLIDLALYATAILMVIL